MAFLATELRPPRADGGEALTRLAAETGAIGVHLGADCDLELVARAPLVGAALRLGLSVPSLTLPLAERQLPAGRRLPRLSAAAKDERAAAITLVERGLDAAVAFGASHAVLELGTVSLAADPAALATAFARRALDSDETGSASLAMARDERRARAPEILDACRFSLERLLRAADRASIQLAAQVGVTPWQAPSPRELSELAETFGPSLGVVWDPARLSVLSALALPISDDRLRALSAAATVVLENDAVGLAPGYLPGLAERDPRLSTFTPPPTIPRIILGPPDSTDAEVVAALATHG